MEGYDVNIYNGYLRNNDYAGLADYISQFKPEDKIQREELKQYARTLRRYGHMATAVLNTTDDEESRQLLSFNLQRENGLYDINNKYAKRYGEALNNIGGSNAATIHYNFNNEEDYLKFIEESGLNFGSYDKDNPNASYHYIKNGKHGISIKKSEFNNATLFDALNKGLHSLVADFTYTGLAQADPTMFGYQRVSNFNSEAYDENGNLLKKTDRHGGFFGEQERCYNMTKAATDKFQQTLTECYNKVVPSELVSMGYMCDAQRQLNEGATSGAITSEYYNLNMKIIKDYYDTQLKQMSLTGYDVYAIDENETSQTFNEIGNEDKGKYTALVRAAAQQNRVTVGAGMAGGRVGTIITIAPKINEKGEFGTEGNAGYQFFVPGLFEEDARNVMDHDDNAKVMVELAEHQAFNSPYKFIEGGYLKDFDGNGATFTNDIGSIRMDNATIRLQMLRNTWLETGIESVQDYIDDNPKTNEATISALITNFAINMYSRLYGSPYEEDEKTINETAKNEINNIIQVIKSKTL